MTFGRGLTFYVPRDRASRLKENAPEMRNFGRRKTIGGVCCGGKVAGRRVVDRQTLDNDQTKRASHVQTFHCHFLTMPEADEGKMKIAGVYRVNEPIENFRIRVKVLQQTSLLGELFGSEGETRDPNFLQAEERVFVWQEKVLSPFERKYYDDEKNCQTDRQKEYHRQIKTTNVQGSGIFSYTQNDSYEPDEQLLNVESYKSRLSLKNQLAMPTIPNRKPFGERYDKRVVDYNCTEQRVRSNHYFYTEKTMMYILADLSRREDNNSISLRADSEILLCTITYDSVHRTLTVSPDFNKNGERYVVVNDSAVKYDYFIEDLSETRSEVDSEEFDESARIVLDKQRIYKDASTHEELQLSPANILRVFLSMEIASALDFPYDGVYVAYCVDLPRNWTIQEKDKLSGRTQRSRLRNGAAHFSYVTDVTLDCNFTGSSSTISDRWPCLLLAVSSLDRWTRYRTEGYASLPIPMYPGSYKFTVNTWRAAGSIVDRLRRFFTGGGSYELEDITYCNIPTTQNELTLDKSHLMVVPSGRLRINMNIAHQSRSYTGHQNSEYDDIRKMDTDELMRSVENVFQRFKIARERMIRIRAEAEEQLFQR